MRIASLAVFLAFLLVSNAFTQEVKKISDLELRTMLADPSDKLHIINFWATWCGPCVSEIPHFEKVAAEFPSDKVEFVMASLDFPSQYEKKLIPFIKKNKMKLSVVMIEETDYDKWIRDVDPKWQGNIPVTLFFNNAKNLRRFESKPLEERELRDIITDFLLM